jgi:hypothetical protein
MCAMYFKKFVKKIIQKCISSLSDERDAIQKKTFTKWVNKHLKKVRHTNKNLSYKRGRFEEAKVSQKVMFSVF